MLNVSDYVLIGSGPAAIATLHGLPERARITIVTGAKASRAPLSFNVHAKIRSSAKALKEEPGLAHQMAFLHRSKGGLADTAAIGGLANYWGQQFLRYRESDPWPSHIFLTYAAYSQACADIEALFSFNSNIGYAPVDANIADYECSTPRLLDGIAGQSPIGSLAMRRAFEHQARHRSLDVVDENATKWHRSGELMSVHLSNGTSLKTRSVLLCAGAVSTLRLVMASDPDIQAFSLKDHAPEMLYVAGLNKQLHPLRQSRSDHFNALTIEHILNNKTHLFASCYRLSRASLGLLLATFNLPSIFNSTHLPKFVDAITPVQVWSDQTKMQYFVKRNSQMAECVPFQAEQHDAKLDLFKAWLSSFSTVLQQSETPAGHGFHYHGGEVQTNTTMEPLNDYLNDRYGNKVIGNDAAILTNIGCRPHTLTAMAMALHRTRSMHIE